MTSDRVSALRWSIRTSVKRYGKAKTRARCKWFLQGYVITSAADNDFLIDYKQACKDVLGGEW